MQEEQAFLDELERLKMQEKEANEEAEALRKEFAHETENLVIQEGVAKASMADFTNLESVVNEEGLIGTSRFIEYKKDERGVVVRNKKSIKLDGEKKCLLYEIDEEGYFKPPRPGQCVLIFDLESYSNSDYARANLDKKSTTGGCQFLGRRLISWQCKKAEYVAATSCCGQVLWIQNQMLDYGFNFMNTKIYIDNESTICIVKSPDAKFPITDDNVADLLTKAFDVSRFQFLVYAENMFSICYAFPSLSTDSAKVVSWAMFVYCYRVLEEKYRQGSVRNLSQILLYIQALISLLPMITLTTTMADLDSCPKHNMVAYLEKTEGNAEFHEIIDFLTRSSIYHALTVSPVVSTTFVNCFGRLLNDLLLDDANRMPPLPNQAIFDAIQLTGKFGGILEFSDQAKKYNTEGSDHKAQEAAKPRHQNTTELWMQSVSLKHRLARKRSSKKQWVHKESVSKQGRKFAKGEPSVQRDPLFDEIPEDTLDHMETEDAQDVGRTRDIVGEEKENDENVLSTEDVLSTDKEKVSTDKEKVSTDRPIVSTDGSKVSTDRQIEGTDEQIEGTDEQRKAKVLPQMSLKPNAVLREKKKAEKKFKQLASDEEMDRKIQEEWEGEEERNRLAKEKATNEALIRNYNDIKARIEADRLLAEKLQESTVVLCTSLSKKVESLESELKQTKQTYSTALTKLIKRVKKLEQTIKTSQARRRAKVVISDAEEDEEDPSKQGRSLIEELDMDAGISLVPPHVADQGRFDDTQVSDQPEEQLGVFSAAKVLADAAEQRRDVENVQTYTRRRRAVSTGSGGVSTASELVSTAGVKAKDKGKAVMQESEPPKKIKKRVQVQMSIDEELAQKVHEEEQARFNAEQEAKFKAEQEQERLDHETAMKIQEELDAAERQRMAQVHQAAQGFTDDEWDDILARVAADKDFVQQLQAGEKVSDEDLPRKLVELVNQRKKFFAQQRAEAKRNKPMTFTQQKKVQSFVPMDSELEVQRLKRAGQDFVEEPAKRQRTREASGSVQEQTGKEPKAEELS
ncbi:hypothetical protein Tco_0098452 [Tanacetum coccineum]